MPFKPTPKSETARNPETVNLSVKIYAPNAIDFRKMMAEHKLSGQQLIDQMIAYCLADAKAPGKV